MKKKVLLLFGVLALVAAVVIPMAALANSAGNEATQEASTGKATSIEIRAQDYTTAVSTITFPGGTPGSTISNPYNDRAGDVAQTLGAAGTAKPVVTLVNTDVVAYTIWYNTTAFTSDVVSNEWWQIVPAVQGCTEIPNLVDFGNDTNTTKTIDEAGGANCQKDLYLKVDLSATGGQTGTSTLTILGAA